ncbi:hypothetical protein [Novosphingobium sp. FSW06-99]|uniref:hypothetical protein n=1 Tax=Novosphingobium sp. FSW06-99 TaxID=1739113 RepID=UPI00076D7004|nr:hypothetical protein [Novosphingobium sp. FSW06-99]KUR80793.1 hypothetical protein AQZ49_01830 [Novosphingobium sp. FSW06-99]
MTDRPVTIIAPTIQRVIDGTCTRLRRPNRALAECSAGDRLWIREQFHLAKQFEHISPLQALDRGAVPVWSVDVPDLPDYATADLGRRRFARELPKAWHRAHLVVTAVHTEPLQTISDEEIANAGFTARDQYARAWDTALRGFVDPVRSIRPPVWANNPAALVVTFRCVTAPLAQKVERSVA